MLILYTVVHVSLPLFYKNKTYIMYVFPPYGMLFFLLAALVATTVMSRLSYVIHTIYWCFYFSIVYIFTAKST